MCNHKKKNQNNEKKLIKNKKNRIMELALSFLSVYYSDLLFSTVELMNLFIKYTSKAITFTCGIFFTPIFWIKSLKKSIKCPPIENQLLLIPANKLARKIRQRELSSEEVIKAYIARCKEVNPLLNAIVDNCYDAALDKARAVDQFLNSGTKTEEAIARDTPLLGVPVTIKESIGLKGMSNTAGLKLNISLIAQDDADPVKQIKNAGGIPILVSNTPELCMCWETYNYATGTTWNPYDIRKTPGGSSGGESALLASGASILSIGSDIGGSLRLPASFCGVFGHKPSPGWVSCKGHMPSTDSDEFPMFFTMGPMVRYAEDLAMYLKILIQPTINHQLDKMVQLSNVNIFYLENFGSGVLKNIDPEILSGIHTAINYFKNVHKSNVQKAELPDLKYAFEAATVTLLRLDGIETIYSKRLDPDGNNRFFIELLKYIFGLSSYAFSTIVYDKMRTLSQNLPKNYEQFIYDKTNAIKQQFQDILGDNGVMICPTFPSVAHYPYEIYPKFLDVSYMMIFNAIGFPVTQCPFGLNKKGLPMGFQIVASPGNDHLTIAMAHEIEKAFGGWKDPSSNNSRE